MATQKNLPTRMSAAEYRAFLLKQQQERPAKHHNHHVYVFSDGFVSNDKGDAVKHGNIVDHFDSEKEYLRWGQLRLLEKAGRISDLKKQVPLLVHEEFIDAQGKKHRATFYNADFTYVENGTEIVEDVKGLDKATGKYLTTQVFNLKWKLLQARYPEKTFRLY